MHVKENQCLKMTGQKQIFMQEPMLQGKIDFLELCSIPGTTGKAGNLQTKRNIKESLIKSM